MRQFVNPEPPLTLRRASLHREDDRLSHRQHFRSDLNRQYSVAVFLTPFHHDITQAHSSIVRLPGGISNFHIEFHHCLSIDTKFKKSRWLRNKTERDRESKAFRLFARVHLPRNAPFPIRLAAMMHWQPSQPARV